MQATPIRPAPLTTAATPSRRAGEAFAAPQAPSAAAPPAPLSGLTPTPALAGLMALQIDPVARRARALERGRAALDALGRMERALLGAGGPADALEALREARIDVDEPLDDPRLASILLDIETRRAVEQAKVEHSLASTLLDPRSNRAL